MSRKNPKTNEINGTPQKDQKLVSVVSKKIYDTIREKLLPYSAPVSWAVIKLLWLLVFSYGILELVRMLHTFNTTAGIKVVVTARLVFCHVYLIRLPGMQEAKREKKRGKRIYN